MSSQLKNEAPVFQGEHFVKLYILRNWQIYLALKNVYFILKFTKVETSDYKFLIKFDWLQERVAALKLILHVTGFAVLIDL